MIVKQPLISIGLPVYNGEKHLSQAIESLLMQSHNNFELIISDNASTDKTQEICLRYKKKDKRIHYYRNSRNLGPIWNFNLVFNLAKSKYFMWAADDDYWQPQYIQSCLNGFNLSNNLVLVSTQSQIINWNHKQALTAEKKFSTVGFRPWRRCLKFLSLIHRGEYLGIIFYGLYKRKALNKIMPLKNVIGGDHLLLAKLCLEGEFLTIPKKYMIKKFGGTSKTFRDTALAMGIDNDLLINHPILVREFLLQKIIFKTDKLNYIQKFMIGFFSLSKYFCRVWKYQRFI